MTSSVLLGYKFRSRIPKTLKIPFLEHHKPCSISLKLKRKHSNSSGLNQRHLEACVGIQLYCVGNMAFSPKVPCNNKTTGVLTDRPTRSARHHQAQDHKQVNLLHGHNKKKQNIKKNWPYLHCVSVGDFQYGNIRCPPRLSFTLFLCRLDVKNKQGQLIDYARS